MCRKMCGQRDSRNLAHVPIHAHILIKSLTSPQNGRKKRDKGGSKGTICLCVETPAFLRFKINAANNFVDEEDQTEVNDDSGYARVCGVCDRRGKFEPEGGRNRWVPQKIRYILYVYIRITDSTK